MKLIKSKKGATQIWWIIVTALIAILIMVFIIVWFKGSGEKAYTSVDDKIGELGDCDKDNVAGLFDKCPCEAGDVKYDGCSQGQNATSCEASKTSGKIADGCK
ncbi:hypothetical protein COY27_03685 [Candidatus Woesearchaeota archaeon CG_4_10_14_0_2_um_filter_33_13]|nr:MAG: hypothetical protein COY27_03685 [Candidatus Woesearchaeota archaeon CG_4_10_14_0_2_um_filter_33_13]